MLGFTPAEIRRAQGAQVKPKLTLEQLLDIKACQERVQTPLQHMYLMKTKCHCDILDTKNQRKLYVSSKVSMKKSLCYSNTYKDIHGVSQ